MLVRPQVNGPGMHKRPAGHWLSTAQGRSLVQSNVGVPLPPETSRSIAPSFWSGQLAGVMVAESEGGEFTVMVKVQVLVQRLPSL